MEHHGMDFPITIIETTDNRFWQVRETGSADLAHVWLGIEMKYNRATDTFTRKANRKGQSNRPTLVSKAHLYRIHVENA
jgi:hypothetical protein